MALDRQIAFQITGDTAGWSRAVTDAQKLNEQAQANAARLNANLQRLDAELLQNHIAMLSATTEAETAAAERRLTVLNTLYEETTVAAQRSAEAQVAAEAKVTAATVEGSATQASAVKAGVAEQRTAVGALQKDLQTLAGAFVGFQIFRAVAQGAKDAVTGYADLGHAISNTALLMNTSAENASVLRFNLQQLGMNADSSTRLIVMMTQSMQMNTAEFERLGVATRDANGNLLNAYDTFTNLREVISGAGDDNNKLATVMDTVARAASRGGVSIADLERMLSMTDAQWQANAKNAAELGLVMNDQTAAAADNLWKVFQQVQQEERGLSIGLSTSLAPAVEWAAHAMLVAIEVAKEYGRVLGDLLTLNFSAAGSDFAAAGTWDQILSKVDAQMAAAKAIGGISGGGGLPGPVTGRGGSGQAIKDQQDALKAALERYTAEKQAAIDAINEEKQARDSAFGDRIEHLRTVENERKVDHQAAIDAINEETQTLSDQYALRKRASDDAIAGLREQISALDRAFSIETASDQLKKDQKSLHDTAAGGPVTIRRGEHLEDYYKRVHDHELKLVDEQKKVEDDKEKIARDAQKAILQEQIKTIEAIAKADQRQLEDKKKIAADEIKDIQAIQKVEEQRAAKAIADLRDQMKEADKQSAAKIKGLQAEMKAEKERVDDQVIQLERLLKAQQSLATGMSAAWKSALEAIAAAAAAAKTKVDELHASLAAINRDNAPGGVAAGGAPHEGDVQQIPRMGRMVFHNGEWRQDTITEAPAGGSGFLPLGILGFGAPSETHASGGSMLLTQPTALVGLHSGGIVAVAGAGETATISPRGGRAGGLIVQLIMPNGAVLAEAVLPHVRAEQAREDDAAASFGYQHR